jgi:UDP-N-acetylglucosamine/UDP-N-acetylgalactosamine 4-epimerase
VTAYELLKGQLTAAPRTWLVTGVAGFIGSNLLEHLLKLDQTVVGLDNFCTGHRKNLDQVRSLVSDQQWARFQLIEGDIRDTATCARACTGVDYVLHQAALGSVPRSIDNPQNTNENNVTGTLNMLVAARDAKVQRLVYASSSAVYGDHPALPKQEPNIGRCLSPYAVSKQVCEQYADQFARHYQLGCIGLRYFNVFGPRQDPNGPYAAVIPKWVSAMIAGDQVLINGTGETSRDFCFVENVVQINLLAATCPDPGAVNQVFNAALDARTSLNELFELLLVRLVAKHPHLAGFAPVYRDFRAGDVMHSQADISKAKRLLGFSPTHTIGQGLDLMLR